MNQDYKIIKYVVQKNHILRPVDVKRFTSGVVNRVYDLGEFVLKIEGDPTGGAPRHALLKHLPEMTEKLLAKGARVPKIIDFDEIEGKPYVLMEKIQGRNLSYGWMGFSDAKKESIIEQLATELRIWHSFSFNQYSIPIVSEEYFDNLDAAIGRLAKCELEKVKKGNLPDYFFPQLQVLENFYRDHIAELNETGTAVLVHQDIHLENIFYFGNNLTGIIDMDWVCQAPKDYELWKILDVVHAPMYTVEGQLEPLYEGYQMTKEFNWLKKYYPELFQVENLANRIRLFYIDPLVETIIDFQNGRWSEKALKKVSDKIRDFYQNDWLDEFLSV